jgi:hypothetical protein
MVVETVEPPAKRLRQCDESDDDDFCVGDCGGGLHDDAEALVLHSESAESVEERFEPEVRSGDSGLGPDSPDAAAGQVLDETRRRRLEDIQWCDPPGGPLINFNEIEAGAAVSVSGGMALSRLIAQRVVDTMSNEMQLKLFHAVVAHGTRREGSLYSGSDMYFDLQEILLDVVKSHPRLRELGLQQQQRITVEQCLASEKVKFKYKMIASKPNAPKMITEDSSFL